MFVCCLEVSLAWKTVSCQTDNGNRVKHSQIWQGTSEEDANILIPGFAVMFTLRQLTVVIHIAILNAMSCEESK